MPESLNHNLSPQLHKIKRQVIELRIASEAEAAPLQAEMRDIQQRQLLPLIDRYCSELADPERIYRIDTLEIDLGHVDAANLRDDFSARVAAPLRKALAAEIEQAEQRAGGDGLAAQSSLELFEFFVRTGSLPWWADTSRPQLLDEVLQRLLESAPGPLARSMRTLSDADGDLKRLVLHYPDALLTRLVLVMVPSLGGTLPDFFTELLDLLQGTKDCAARPQARARTSVWMVILHTACRARAPHAEPVRFWREAVLQLAADSGVTYAALASGLYQSVQARGACVGGPLGAVAEHLYRDIAEPPRVAPGEARPSRPSEPVPVDLSFSDADVLYLNNAGLVLLWPFLQNFFKHLGLVEEKQFIDEAAMQRGVGLLQYIAGADESPAEPLLPLNKVLCGMAPEAVFDFGAEITEQEMQECNDLLTAVIQQAPILHEMSLAGFRASFLLRKGQLGTRDGHWLLRVERETHDIVLDRFPWGVHIVKLPWMAAMMQVEW